MSEPKAERTDKLSSEPKAERTDKLSREPKAEQTDRLSSEPEAEQTDQRGGAIVEQCDVCGRDVPADDVIRTELTVAGAMCPTAMTFHTACFEQASSMWQPDPDSYCTVDPLFPETGKWVLPEDSARPGRTTA